MWNLQERERLAKFFKQNYSLDMLDRELSVKGWNYGTANFKGGVLGFEVGSKEAFEIPLSYVNQCLPGKNEVTLEFHNNDDAAVMLSEMRFHIPQSQLAGADDPVEVFKEQVMKKASVVTTAGDAIAIFSEIHCLSPRGRYDIKVRVVNDKVATTWFETWKLDCMIECNECYFWAYMAFNAI